MTNGRKKRLSWWIFGVSMAVSALLYGYPDQIARWMVQHVVGRQTVTWHGVRVRVGGGYVILRNGDQDQIVVHRLSRDSLDVTGDMLMFAARSAHGDSTYRYQRARCGTQAGCGVTTMHVGVATIECMERRTF